LQLQLRVSRYLAEEYDHCGWLRVALEKAGLTPAAIDDSVPVPGILATIHFLRCTAATDFLAYFILLGMNEQHGFDETWTVRRKQFWERLQSKGWVPEEVLTPFLRHEVADVEGGHARFTEIAFEDQPPVDADRQRSLLRTAVLFGRTTAAAERDVLEHYRHNPQDFGVVWG
jgi:hypothetical protein